MYGLCQYCDQVLESINLFKLKNKLHIIITVKYCNLESRSFKQIIRLGKNQAKCFKSYRLFQGSSLWSQECLVQGRVNGLMHFYAIWIDKRTGHLLYAQWKIRYFTTVEKLEQSLCFRDWCLQGGLWVFFGLVVPMNLLTKIVPIGVYNWFEGTSFSISNGEKPNYPDVT